MIRFNYNQWTSNTAYFIKVGNGKAKPGALPIKRTSTVDNLPTIYLRKKLRKKRWTNLPGQCLCCLRILRVETPLELLPLSASIIGAVFTVCNNTKCIVKERLPITNCKILFNSCPLLETETCSKNLWYLNSWLPEANMAWAREIQ